MARKEPDNFYRRQQEEANRIAVKQHRALVDLVKLAKSSNEELRKMRRAFEAFAEAMLGMKIEPFQAAALSEAARGQVAEFDIKGFKETLLKGEALTVPEGKPYPKVDFTPKPGDEKRVEYVERTRRLGYGDVIEANDDFIKTEHASGKGGAELADLGLVIGVDLALDDPAEHALIATRRAVESNDRLVVICDELATRELLLTVEHERDSRLFGIGEEDEAVIAWQRVALVERVREKVAESERARVATIREKLAIVDEAPAGTVQAAIQESIDNGEHPPALDGLDQIGAPEEECADVSEARRTPQGYATGGYTGVSDGPFAEPQPAGIVHPGELWGTAEHLRRMRDLGLIAEGTITHETDAQIDLGR